MKNAQCVPNFCLVCKIALLDKLPIWILQELKLRAAADHLSKEVQERGDLDCYFEGAGAQTVLLGKRLGLTETSIVFEGAVRGIEGVLKVGLPSSFVQSMKELHIPLHDQVIFWPIYESFLHAAFLTFLLSTWCLHLDLLIFRFSIKVTRVRLGPCCREGQTEMSQDPDKYFTRSIAIVKIDKNEVRMQKISWRYHWH